MEVQTFRKYPTKSCIAELLNPKKARIRVEAGRYPDSGTKKVGLRNLFCVQLLQLVRDFIHQEDEVDDVVDRL